MSDINSFYMVAPYAMAPRQSQVKLSKSISRFTFAFMVVFCTGCLLGSQNVALQTFQWSVTDLSVVSHQVEPSQIDQPPHHAAQPKLGPETQPRGLINQLRAIHIYTHTFLHTRSIHIYIYIYIYTYVGTGD